MSKVSVIPIYNYSRGSLDLNKYRTWIVLNFNYWLENQK